MRRPRNTLRFMPRLGAVTMRARVLKSKRQRPKRTRRGGRRALVAGVIGMLSVPIVAYGAHVLVEHLHRAPEYTVKEIRVEGASLFTPDEIVAKSKLKLGVPILDTPIRTARRALVDDPMIQAATIVRCLPNTLIIEVTEREPIARLSSGGTTYLVDGDGYVFPLTESMFLETLPRIQGVPLKKPRAGTQVKNEKLKTALTIIELYLRSPLPELMRIESLDVHNLKKVRLYALQGPNTSASATFILGDGEFGLALAKLDETLRHQDRPVRWADLRLSRVPVRTD